MQIQIVHLFRLSVERDSNDHAGVLKTRCQETSQQESLPELGAILGRGSFGKVFKGAHFPSYICPADGIQLLLP